MKGLRLLIIDDSSLAREALKVAWEPLHAEITEATSGSEGLSLALNSHFDLIVTDVSMPGLNGIELCNRLKNNPDTHSVPIIMVSGFDNDADIRNGFLAGASEYISKESIKAALLPKVENILSKFKFFQNRLILVVDDSPFVRNFVKQGLAKAGFKVLAAENGKAARELLKEVRPDLILSDIEMPLLNGLALCQEVKTSPELAAIPFVVMSGFNDRGHMMRMIQNGAAAYVPKPFSIDQLIILLDKLLSDQFLLLLKERERLDTERNLMLSSIASLISALEARDPYTKGHSEAVANIATGIATLMGKGKTVIDRVALGGQLHDIGKIGIKDSILLKTGKLTSEEFEQIKHHPTIGASILSPISSLNDIIPFVLSHHERVDGRGYPQGLKSSQIPECARIIAVADTFDALASDRPYRQGIAQAKAFQMIEDASGTQLCPDAVELFFEWMASQGANASLPQKYTHSGP